MQAFQINKYGDNSVLEQVEIPVPKILPNQLLVKLKTSSVNPVDYKIRSGYLSTILPKTFPFTLGWEGAGVIVEVGIEVKNFKQNDEIIIISNLMQGGTYAEYVAVSTNEIMHKPSFINFEEASTIPYSLGTAYMALVENAKIQSGQKLLILGAGGAVGQMAVQIAKNKGLYVMGTATGEHIQELNNLGINQVIDYLATDFSTICNDIDVVLDLVGGEILAKSYTVVKKGGTIISTVQPPNTNELEKYKLTGKMSQTKFDENVFLEIMEWLKAGIIKIKKPQVFTFSNAKEALSMVENRKAKSKVVITF